MLVRKKIRVPRVPVRARTRSYVLQRINATSQAYVIRRRAPVPTLPLPMARLAMTTTNAPSMTRATPERAERRNRSIATTTMNAPPTRATRWKVVSTPHRNAPKSFRKVAAVNAPQCRVRPANETHRLGCSAASSRCSGFHAAVREKPPLGADLPAIRSTIHGSRGVTTRLASRAYPRQTASVSPTGSPVNA